MRTIDMRGQPCPIPVINAKRALAEPGADGVTVLVDNAVATQNLEKMARGLGLRFSCDETSPACFSVEIGGDGEKIPAESIVPARDDDRAPCGLVVMIGSDHMGEGADELGRMLLKGFIFSLTQLDRPPDAVIFFNGGARLTSAGSNAVPDLETLRGRGARILTCGTCVNYYELKDSHAVGEITDMMDITQRAASAERLITI